jgi:hypothetical protein
MFRRPGNRVSLRGLIPPGDLTPTEVVVGLILVVLLLALVLGAVGFVLHVLWWLALIVLVVWVAGFLFRGGDSARWYGR